MHRLVLLALFASACATEASPQLRFAMFETNDLRPFTDAWSTAAANPGESVHYTFPVVSEGLDERVEIRLVVGRSTNQDAPVVVGDDVMLADEHALAMANPDADGRAEFSTLAVEFGDVAPGTGTIPWDYMCGYTVVAARAFRGNTRLASTWVVANPDCAIF
ncbi:MAG: hypothetical protein SFX73_20375 [Kofleriaceae bacterium]|nr:hypothetical protein [Kofleriaceae bacterium]